MKPYYEDRLVRIYHGSCLDIGEWLDAGILVTDPPYGMGYVSARKPRPIAGDDTPEIRDEVLQRWGDRSALVFGHWRVPHPPQTKMCLTWDKGNGPGMGDLRLPWGPSSEEIYVIGRDFVGKRSGSVIHVNRPRFTATRRHPTEKPIELMKQLLAKCDPKLTIADPFMGSGSTLVAAKLLGRQAIGVEMDRQYCDVAVARLKEIQ